ncbi:MAG TPA: hypothetical protein VGC66_24875 [Pyrinomonadaceae bacterium]|jgi:hypothetical protein
MKVKALTVGFIIALLLLANSGVVKSQGSSSGQERGVGLIYGVDHVFALAAPSGWVLDNTSGVSQGLHAVFYPKGASWADSKMVMYANTVHKEKSGLKTLKAVIDDDVKNFRKYALEAEITDEPNLTTKDKKQAVVKYFYDKEHGNFEEVAFIDESKIVVVLVLSARTRKDYEEALPAFRQLVGSYYFVTDKVTLDSK